MLEDCPAPKGLCVERASGEYLKCEYWLMLELGTFVEVNMPESEIHGSDCLLLIMTTT